jgi:hypothetical protein
MSITNSASDSSSFLTVHGGKERRRTVAVEEEESKVKRDNEPGGDMLSDTSSCDKNPFEMCKDSPN